MSHHNDETLKAVLTLTADDGTSVKFETTVLPGQEKHPAGMMREAVLHAHETIQMMREKKAAEKAAQRSERA